LLEIAIGLAAGHVVSSAQESGWHDMFDGKSLEGWIEPAFIRRGKVEVRDGMIVLGSGAMTGVNYTKPFPRYNYELRLEAARLEGDDFFAGITFPVGDAYCSWINGGWGGRVVGLSSLDDEDASENETSRTFNFVRGRWYRLRLRVAGGWIQAWIDDELVISVETEGRKVSLREATQIDLSVPLGFTSYSTVGALRHIEYREVGPEERQ